MNASKKAPTTIDEYIADFKEPIRSKLNQVRETIKQIVPDAKEIINYGIPTFVWNGKLVHFGGYEHHIGFYPTPSAIEAFKDEVKQYKSAKGSIQFPLDQELPIDLIKRMVEFRVAQNKNKA